MSRFTRVAALGSVAALAFTVFVPRWLDSYAIDVLTTTLILLPLTLSTALIMGFVGELSLCQGTFFGFAAYFTAIMNARLGTGMWVNAPFALLFAALVAWLFGIIAFKLRGPYFGVVTLAFAEILAVVARSWKAVTNSTAGLAGIDPAMLGFGNTALELYDEAFFLVAVGGAVVAGLFLVALVRSRLGRAFVMIRENEALAMSLGVDELRVKRTAFALSAALAALSGVLYAHYIGFVGPNVMSPTYTINAIMMAVLGGAGSVAGGIIGTFIVYTAPELLRVASEYRVLVFGVITLVIMIVAKGGIMGVIRAVLARSSGVTAVSGTQLLEVDAVTVRFMGLQALKGIRLGISQGEILGIIGPNGAGKSTLINAVTGYVTPAGGTIRYRGTDITGMPPHQVAQMGIIRTFQLTSAFPRLTVFENVVAARHRLLRSPLWSSLVRGGAARREEEEGRRKALEVLDLCGLGDVREVPAEELPYGALRRLGVAVALATEPALLLLDEPGAGLNDREAAELGQMLETLCHRGLTIGLIDHNMRLVMKVCTRIVVLNEGLVIAEGRPEQVRAMREVREAYLGSSA